MSLQPSQFILIAAIITFGLYVFRLRTIVVDRVIYLALAWVGIVLVLVPDLSTAMANLVGIGRGTDLVLYVFVVFSLFHFVTLASHLNNIERRITAVVRRGAIEGARVGGPRTTDGQ